jgi:hypothetical protein
MCACWLSLPIAHLETLCSKYSADREYLECSDCALASRREMLSPAHFNSSRNSWACTSLPGSPTQLSTTLDRSGGMGTSTMGRPRRESCMGIPCQIPARCDLPALVDKRYASTARAWAGGHTRLRSHCQRRAWPIAGPPLRRKAWQPFDVGKSVHESRRKILRWIRSIP